MSRVSEQRDIPNFNIKLQYQNQKLIFCKSRNISNTFPNV